MAESQTGSGSDHDRPHAWGEVWKSELDTVQCRRDRMSRNDPNAEGSVPRQLETGAGDTNSDDDDTVEEAARRATAMELVGLAFSGGGIRSATFNLGVLQGLAELRMLKYVDYLSTVSGGGYIGAWFAALVQRQESLEKAENILQPRRHAQPDAESCHSVSPTIAEREPEPIAHLRAYSNYLAPRLSLSSNDALALISAYTRSLVASLLVLLPALIAVIAGVRVAHTAFVCSTLMEDERVIWAIFALVIVFVLASFALIGMNLKRIQDVSRHLEGHVVPKSRQTHLSALLNRLPGGLLPLAIVLGSWLVSVEAVSEAKAQAHFGVDLYLLLIGVFGGFAGVSSCIQWAVSSHDEFPAPAIWARTVAGAAGGLLVAFVIDSALHSEWIGQPSTRAASVDFVIGAPLLMLTSVLIFKIELALAGAAVQEAEREWWGRLNAAVARLAVIWFLTTFIVIFGPFLVIYVEAWASALTAGWIASTAGGLIAGRSQSKEPPAQGKKLLLSCAPYIFVLGLACLLSLGVAAFRGDLPESNPKVATASDDSVKEQDESSKAASFSQQLCKYLCHVEGTKLKRIALLLGGCIVVAVYASRRVDINACSMNSMYANRLTRCYLGASRAKASDSDGYGKPVSTKPPRREPHPWTEFDPADDLELCELQIAENQSGYDGPLHLFNTTINLAGSDALTEQDRKSNVFTLSPFFCGNARLGYRPTDRYAGGLTVGRAIAISGAAANPNMGQQTSPAMAALMTLFNVRLGWWAGNPRDRQTWSLAGPKWALGSLLTEMLSRTDSDHGYVNLSDGGHYENLAVYELVRRRCRYIIAVDAGADPDYEFVDIANLTRRCRIDLGIDIEIETGPVTPDAEAGHSEWHCVLGRIRYDNVDPQAPLGTLVLLKPTLTGNESADIANYRRQHESFPQQTTADQFFSESQFESYRRLGHHVAREVFKDAELASRNS